MQAPKLGTIMVGMCVLCLVDHRSTLQPGLAKMWQCSTLLVGQVGLNRQGDPVHQPRLRHPYPLPDEGVTHHVST